MSEQSKIQPIIINGHGSKTQQTFEIQNHILLTPGNLNTSYVFSVNPNYNIETDFLNNQLKPVNNGNWTVYQKDITPQVPEVKIGPWQYNDYKSFANAILKNPNHWSQIDNQTGYYLDRDENATLVVKNGNSYTHLNAAETKMVLEDISHNNYDYQQEGKPLFFYAPEVGKIKILSETSLSEILEQVDAIDGAKLVMLATCNATSNNTTISYETYGQTQSVTELLAQHDVQLSGRADLKNTDQDHLPIALEDVISLDKLNDVMADHVNGTHAPISSSDNQNYEAMQDYSNINDSLEALPPVIVDLS